MVKLQQFFFSDQNRIEGGPLELEFLYLELFWVIFIERIYLICVLVTWLKLISIARAGCHSHAHPKYLSIRSPCHLPQDVGVSH